MSLTTTVTILVAALAVFGVALYRDRQPVDPARPRLLPYAMIMMVAIVVALVMGAHLVGHLTSR